jgi:DNA modification methylase
MMGNMELLLDGRVQLYCGNMIDVLPTLPENSVDSCVVDPPYHLQSIVKRFGKTSASGSTKTEQRARERSDGMARVAAGFMGKQWDGGDIAFQKETWNAVYRVLKPGAYLLAFSGTRTYHRMACAIEDSGFVVYDMIAWTYGSGFPKSHNPAKAIDATLTLGGSSTHLLRRRDMGETYQPHHKAGMEGYGDGSLRKGCDGDRPQNDTKPLQTDEAKQWDGFGTALKPAMEPICLAQKPRDGTIAENVLKWGCGAMNIDGCRVPTTDDLNGGVYTGSQRHDGTENWGFRNGGARKPLPGDERVGAALGMFQEGKTVGIEFEQPSGRWPANIIHDGSDEVLAVFPERDSDSAARFFYCAKASKKDRADSKHPTVKPIKLVQYLVKLVTPPDGVVLDCFAGTGTTGEAAYNENCKAILIEWEKEYCDDIRHRMKLLHKEKKSNLETFL